MDLSGIYSNLDNWNNADTWDHNWRNPRLMGLFLVESYIMSLMFGVDEMMEVGPSPTENPEVIIIKDIKC